MLVIHLQLGGMPQWRRGVGQGGAGNQELEDLRWRIEELENRRNGDAKVYSESKEEIKEEYDVEERHLVVRMISYLSNGGSGRVKVSNYDGNMRVYVLIGWIAKLKVFFKYENVQDPNQKIFSLQSWKNMLHYAEICYRKIEWIISWRRLWHGRRWSERSRRNFFFFITRKNCISKYRTSKKGRHMFASTPNIYLYYHFGLESKN